MKIIKIHLVFFFALILSPSINHAALVDQVNDPDFPNSTLYVDWGVEWQQEVTTGVSGQLAGIELLMSNITTSIFVNTGSGWQSDTHDYVTSVTGASANFSWVYIDLTSANLFYDASDVFVLGSKSPAFAPNLPGFKGTSYNSYAAGSLFRNEALRSGDFAFKTYVTPVPLPTTSILLATGISTILMFAGIKGIRPEEDRFI